jgi:hypothetical protein
MGLAIATKAPLGPLFCSALSFLYRSAPPAVTGYPFCGNRFSPWVPDPVTRFERVIRRALFEEPETARVARKGGVAT